MFNFNAKSRYTTYAAIMILAAAAYFWLGQAAYPPRTSAGMPFAASAELPALKFLDHSIQAGENRDLFSFVKFEQKPESAFGSAIDRTQTPIIEIAPNPDLLADLKVIGLVRRSNQVTVLLQIGTKISTVGLGERFGAGDALSVEAVQDSNVLILDRTQKVSKLYALSEE